MNIAMFDEQQAALLPQELVTLLKRAVIEVRALHEQAEAADDWLQGIIEEYNRSRLALAARKWAADSLAYCPCCKLPKPECDFAFVREHGRQSALYGDFASLEAIRYVCNACITMKLTMSEKLADGAEPPPDRESYYAEIIPKGDLRAQKALRDQKPDDISGSLARKWDIPPAISFRDGQLYLGTPGAKPFLTI